MSTEEFLFRLKCFATAYVFFLLFTTIFFAEVNPWTYISQTATNNYNAPVFCFHCPVVPGEQPAPPPEEPKTQNQRENNPSDRRRDRFLI